MPGGKRPHKQISRKCKNVDCLVLTSTVYTHFWSDKFCSLNCHEAHVSSRGTSPAKTLNCSNGECVNTVPFDASINNQFVYCSPACKSRVRNKRRNRRHGKATSAAWTTEPSVKAARSPSQPLVAGLNVSAVCPKPNKKGFITTQEAWEWIDLKHAGDEFMSAYRCQCGSIHIGHMVRKRSNTLPRPAVSGV